VFVVKRRYENYEDRLDFIDKIVYINLDNETERREKIEKDLSVLSPNKVVRFSAIRDSPGHIGCSKSHIACIEMAIKNKWKNVLIVEDDAMWNNYDEGVDTLIKLVTEHPDYDVITLGNVGAVFDKNTFKLESGQTTTAYLVNQHYYERLLENFKEGLSKLLITKELKTYKEQEPYNYKYCIDQYWKKLQKTDNWYIVNPALMIQRPSRSDIAGGEVDYTGYFNL